MQGEELENYQKSTKFQKDLIDALLNLGFEYTFHSKYFKSGFCEVNTSKFKRWSDVLKYIHNEGKQQKMWEIQGVLGIIQ